MAITIANLVNRFNQLANADPRVNAFGSGPLYDIIDDIKYYPYLWIQNDVSHNIRFTDINKYRALEYNFILRVGDKVNNQENVYMAYGENSNNGLDISSDTFTILVDMVNAISEDSLGLFSDVTLIDDISVEPFFHEDTGDVNGHMAQIVLRAKITDPCLSPITDDLVPPIPPTPEPGFNRFVYCDPGGYVYVSDNLVDWTTVDVLPIQEENRFVFMPSRNRIYLTTREGYNDLVSDDGGLNWVEVGDPVLYPFPPVYADSIDTLIVIDALTKQIKYSTDGGVTFNAATHPVLGPSNYFSGAWSETLGLFSIIVNPTQYMINPTYVLTSPDGINWTVTNQDFILESQAIRIVWAESMGLFVGMAWFQDGLGTSYTGSIYSSDGVNWDYSAIGLRTATGNPVSLAYDPVNGVLMCPIYRSSGNVTDIYTSNDGVNWTVVNTISGWLTYTSWSPDYGFALAYTNGSGVYTTDLGVTLNNWTGPLLVGPGYDITYIL